MLEVLRFSRMDSRGKNSLWLCKCDCGKEVEVRKDVLKRNQSCGCAVQASVWNATHGKTYTSEYLAYWSARDRCINPKNSKWSLYGGRGIEFHFMNFFDFWNELGEKPTPKHTLDRKNTDGHYEVGNVRWATYSEQNSNRRTYRRRRKI